MTGMPSSRNIREQSLTEHVDVVAVFLSRYSRAESPATAKKINKQIDSFLCPLQLVKSNATCRFSNRMPLNSIGGEKENKKKLIRYIELSLISFPFSKDSELLKGSAQLSAVKSV